MKSCIQTCPDQAGYENCFAAAEPAVAAMMTKRGT